MSCTAPDAAAAGRRRATRLLLFLSLLPILPAGLGAVPPSGSLIDPIPGAPRPGQLTNEEQRNRYVDAYAGCIVRSHRRLAERVLAEPYLSPAQYRLVLAISDPGCLGGGIAQLRYPAPQLVGRIAQVLIRERYAGADIGRFAALSDEAAGQLGLTPRNNAEDMAFCILRRDPQTVRALVETPFGSGEETAAIRRLVPHLAPCAAAGETLKLNQAAVRLLLAAGLYRALSITIPAAAEGR